MRNETVTVPLRDGSLNAYVAYPDKTPAGAIIAIMEIWGVNDTMRRHAHEFAEAGYVCLVPDLFWRQEPGVELDEAFPVAAPEVHLLGRDLDPEIRDGLDAGDTSLGVAEGAEKRGEVLGGARAGEHRQAVLRHSPLQKPLLGNTLRHGDPDY